MGKRVLVAVNSRARRGRDARDAITKALRARGHEVVSIALDDPRELSAAIVAHREEVDAVVVGGGDGTLLGAIAGLIETKLPLLILPIGTVNELARTLGVPSNPDAVAALLDDGERMQIDAGCVNGVYYFNEASVGLSTRVARMQTGRLKRALGMLVIPVTTLRAMRWMRPLHLEITSEDGSTRSVRVVQLTIANSYRFGGVVENPEGSLEDGKLWLYSIDVRSWRNALGVLAAVAMRRFAHSAEVVAVPGRRFSVRSRHGGRHRVYADSENVTRLPAEFTVAPRAVLVAVPASRVGSIH
jgi:YegS/Rv2252/BmrU family lipid kinase